MSNTQLLATLVDRTDEVNPDTVDLMRSLREEGRLNIDSRRVADQMISSAREDLKHQNGQ